MKAGGQGPAATDRPAPRRVAMEVLLRLDKGPVDLQAALDAAFKPDWQPRDRRLATELTFGTARWRYRIDPLIKRLTGRRLKDLDRPTRTLLRLGCYQLLFMDRTPAPVAVSETVALAGPGRRRGFINGVLRGLLRRIDADDPNDPPFFPIAPPTFPEGVNAHFAASHGLPPWLAARWLARYGHDGATARAEQANARPPLTLRVNTARTSRAELAERLRAAGHTVTESQYVDTGLCLTGSVRDLPGYDEGHFYVQDEASQWVAELLGAAPGERVLDVCSAPGGKATQLATMVGVDGAVVALERDAGRMKRLHENIARLGLKNIQVVRGDAGQVAVDDLGGPFDRVLLDAPCSGLGVLNRHPEGKWWKSESVLLDCAAGQVRLLDHAAHLVRPGGHLVYAVCSGELEETEQVVDGFLADHADFVICPADTLLGERAAPWLTSRGYLDTSGNRVGMDGFFAAHLVRDG